MNQSNRLILQVHLPGAEPYELGDEIWQQPLTDATRTEAESIAEHAGTDLLRPPGQAGRVTLRDRVIIEMTTALQKAEDAYTASDGVAYTLTEQAGQANWKRSWRAPHQGISTGGTLALRMIGL